MAVRVVSITPMCLPSSFGSEQAEMKLCPEL